ncbi:MAG: zinc-dependent peptidase [Vitreoscilla sp.]|nr:zinc-dependent peptidase [Polaromonas sp.]
MLGWLHNLITPPRTIPAALWQATLAQHSFLAERSVSSTIQLRALTEQFLTQKQFSGAHGLVVTDEMAVAIAAQACLPVLNFGLKLYNDFKGIVVHPGAMLARRRTVDAAGVHHFYKEQLVGEAMQGGPVTLSWQDVAASSEHTACGYNVVIHEFVHKIDMRDGTPNGCPPLPSRQARAAWQAGMKTAYDAFKEKIVMAERFGGQPPWLDAYAATSPAEFFAVASEAYFVNPTRFETDFADLKPLFDTFFSPKSR